MDPIQETQGSLPELSADDARILDALLEARARQGDGTVDGDGKGPWAYLSPDDLPKAERIGKWLDLLGHCPGAAPPADLVQRTLAAVEETRRAERMMLQSQASGGGRGFNVRWAELGTVAALLLVGVSLLWPALDHAREDARRVACQSNLAIAGAAMGRYANDYDRVLPRREAVPGDVWWNVGKIAGDGEPVQSNSAHLYQLVRSGYASADTLACPDNAMAPRAGAMTAAMHDWSGPEAVSYSYQNQYTRSPIRIDRAPKLVVLADKNPLFVPRGQGAGLTYNTSASPTAPSPFHGRQGQNVLTADGRVTWTEQPILEGDNFWMPEGVRPVTGREVPNGPDDSFVAP